jgi:lauroyl/myristoyl acyltransferase
MRFVWPCGVALKTGAAVIPAFMLWEPSERQYVLHFGNELVFDRTDDPVADIVAATQKCSDELESWIRRYPDQWLWISRRRASSCSVEMVTRIQPGSGPMSACG